MLANIFIKMSQRQSISDKVLTKDGFLKSKILAINNLLKTCGFISFCPSISFCVLVKITESETWRESYKVHSEIFEKYYS